MATVPGMSALAFGISSVLVVPLNVDLTPAARSVRPGVAGLVDDHDDFLRPGLVELLAGALARDLLVLADVQSYVGRLSNAPSPEFTVMISMPGLGRLRERILERARVRHRGRDHVGLGRDRGVDARDLLRHVVVRVDLRDADAPGLEVLGGLVDAVLEHRPERAGVAVRHDGDLGRRARATRREGLALRAECREAGREQSPLDDQAAAGEPSRPPRSSRASRLRFPLPVSFVGLPVAVSAGGG